MAGPDSFHLLSIFLEHCVFKKFSVAVNHKINNDVTIAKKRDSVTNLVVFYCGCSIQHNPCFGKDEFELEF